MTHTQSVFNICRGENTDNCRLVWQLFKTFRNSSPIFHSDGQLPKLQASIYRMAESERDDSVQGSSSEWISQQKHSCLPTRDQELRTWAAPSSEKPWEHAFRLFHVKEDRHGNLKANQQIPTLCIYSLSRCPMKWTENHTSSYGWPLTTHGRNHCQRDASTPHSHTSGAPGSQREKTQVTALRSVVVCFSFPRLNLILVWFQYIRRVSEMTLVLKHLVTSGKLYWLWQM